MIDETAVARVPLVFVLCVLVTLVMSAVWTARAAIHQHAARYVEQEWQARLSADIERGVREARSLEQQRGQQRQIAFAQAQEL